MTTKLTQLLCTALLLASLILTNFPARTLSDAGECPYPCYPPPTGPGGTTPSTPTPPPPPSQTASNTNPSPSGYYSPPSGYMPYTPPPPPYGGSDGGDGGDYGTPSPPDPIMPYFPYYYRKPPHQPADGSSVAASRVMIMTMTTLVSFLLSFNYL